MVILIFHQLDGEFVYKICLHFIRIIHYQRPF